MDDKTKVVTVRLPELDVEIIDEFVKARLFASRSDFIRFAVYRVLLDWYFGVGMDEDEVRKAIREVDEEVGSLGLDDINRSGRRVLYVRGVFK